MNNVQSKIKKAIKAIVWVVVIVVLISVILAGLVHIPAVQNKIVHAATSFVSKRTYTKVEIKNISIKFPKTVIIEGLFLEDTKKDTLIYAGMAKINIALYGLFSSEIFISSVSLEDAVIRLYSTKTDPLFNYNFLFSSFAGSNQQTQTDTLKVSKWTFSLDDVYLKNTRFTYNDAYEGINVFAKIPKSEFSVDEISPEKSLYRFDEMFIEGLNLIVQTSIPANQPDKSNLETSQIVLPKIAVQKLQLINSMVTYTDSLNYLSVITVLDRTNLEKGIVDVQKELITFDYIYLSESDIRYHTFEPEMVAGSVSSDNSNWKVSVNRIDAANNFLIYKVGDGPELKNEFNGEHLELARLTFEATDFYYDSDLTKISVKNLSTIDQNQFVVNSLETDFSMDQYSIIAEKLKLKTPHSSIDADFHVEFTSLANFTDSLQFSNLKLIMRNVSFRNPDVLYFNPELINQPFFKNRTIVTTMKGAVTGPLNNLTGKNLFIKTGENTVVETDFRISGLPNAKTATYNFPNLKIISGKNDLELMAGDSIPENIALPENINLQIAFKGEAKSFETTMIAASSFGDAQIFATIDKSENFSGKLNTTNFDLGKLLKDTVMYGPVSLTAETNGHGLDKNTVAAKIKAEVSQIYLYQYTYHNFNLDGNISGKEFEGKMNLKDENAVFDFEGLVGLNPDKERVKFRLNVQGADLQKLNFTDNDIRIALVAAADLKGGTVKKLNGSAAITNMIIAQGEKLYTLDSVLFASVNESRKSELNFSSALVSLKYSGTISPADISAELNNFINNYFPFANDNQPKKSREPSDFNFEMQLHNHPILSQVFFPQLKEFVPGIIQGSFDSKKNNLEIKAKMDKIVYGTTEIKDFVLDANSNPRELNYKISSAVSNAQIKLENFLIDGKLADNKINTILSSVDEKKNKKLLIRTEITKDKENFRLTIDPAGFYLMDKQWDIAADNYIEFGKQGFLIHNLFMNKTGSEVNIASVNDRFNDDLNVEIRNFKLEDFSGIIEKDTGFVRGTVDGNALLKRVADSYGLVADAKIANLFVSGIPVGNLTIKAENPTREKFNIDLNLSGAENNLTTKGYYIAKGGDNSISLTTDIQSLSLKAIQAFSMGTITEASGNLSGNFLVEGNSTTPEITGELVFKNAFITPTVLNNRLEIKDETFQLKKDGIYFNDFTIYDASQNSAVINGAVNMNHFTDFAFALSVSTNDFLLFNTTKKDNKVFFGRMIIDSEIEVTGPIAVPVVNATLKMKKGSNFTFAVPEDKLTTTKGEGVIEFENEQKLSPILTRENNKQAQKTNLTGFDVYSVIEIDKQATLRLLMDPSSTDSLVVRGEAALSFTMDRSGQMSLTGAYNLNDGSYLVSLESLIKKRFDIDPGSTIVWNGDPYEAEVDIDATYSVRASPIDLMADQMVGLNETEKGAYKQRYPFLVILKLKGEILHPGIGFAIQLRPEDKGILNGAVNQKLTLLNEDVSALNKQVFALLVLGRFIQENPLQTDAGGGTSTFVRATVGKILSQQLNQWSSKVLPGVELNFDVQSYNQYQTGEAAGRTQVDIGLKKQLFNERLSVQVGGTVEVEGVKAKQNSASDIASDVVLEFKLTKDGRYRLKGFRQNQYESDIDGQFVETGAGISYVRDFDKWTNFFRRTKIEKGKMKKEKKNETIDPK